MWGRQAMCTHWRDSVGGNVHFAALLLTRLVSMAAGIKTMTGSAVVRAAAAAGVGSLRRAIEAAPCRLPRDVELGGELVRDERVDLLQAGHLRALRRQSGKRRRS